MNYSWNTNSIDLQLPVLCQNVKAVLYIIFRMNELALYCRNAEPGYCPLSTECNQLIIILITRPNEQEELFFYCDTWLIGRKEFPFTPSPLSACALLLIILGHARSPPVCCCHLSTNGSLFLFFPFNDFRQLKNAIRLALFCSARVAWWEWEMFLFRLLNACLLFCCLDVCQL